MWTRKKKPSVRVTLTISVCLAWIGAFSLFIFRESRKQVTIHPYYASKVAQMHLSDERVPVLCPLSDSKWLEGYHSDQTVRYEAKEPIISANERPGDNGQAVNIKSGAKSNLYKLNVEASDVIPLNRTLPDFRDER